jgi:hypothetical protein
MKRPLTHTLVIGTMLGAWTYAQQASPAQRSRDLEAKELAVTFKGITANGQIESGLFGLTSTGVSTEPVRKAAEGFLAALTVAQRQKTTFAHDANEWRSWGNQSSYWPRGVSFGEMSAAQREAAIGMMRASLSARGLTLTENIRKLNYTLGELQNNDFSVHNDGRYHLTVMGEPSATEPWGWQFDGHHGIVNYFVLGDQVVMTPVFMGSEPVRAESGRFKGTVVLQVEQDKGLALMRALTPAQQAGARIRNNKSGSDLLADAYKDNLVLDYTGIRAREFTDAQKAQLLGVIEEFVSNMKEGHAKVKMSEVRKHLDDTWFGWIGSTEADGVFYYRIQSPVILIEFDHQRPIALGRSNTATRNHIHAVVRTPNGNDYGKDLLRQHHQKHRH